MKRFFLSVFSILFLGVFVALAQTPPPSPVELQEKVERLSGDVERLAQDNLALRNKLSAMADELSRAREEMAKLNANTGVHDEVARLAKKIQEVDEKRIEDNQTIATQIKKIAENLKEAAKTEVRRPRPTVPDEPKETENRGPEKGYEYVIQGGDTLSTVVYAYNKEFKSKGMKSISLQQVMDANPKVNWNRLQVGQKIFIPMPGK